MTKEEFKETLKEKKLILKEKILDAAQWAADNPEITLGAGALCGKILWEFGRAAKRKQEDKAAHERRSRIYDPTMGASWQLKRELTNKELSELKHRSELGESRYDILSDMKVLKK